MADVIIVAGIVIALFFVVRARLRRMRSGSCCSGCSGNCSSCSVRSEKQNSIETNAK